MVAKLVQTSASELSPDRSASVSTAEALQEDDSTRSASTSAVSRQDMSAEHCVAIKRPMSIRNRAEDGMKAHQGPHNGLIIVLTLSFLCFLINTATNSGVHLARATGECNATIFDKKLLGCFGLTYLSCLSVQHSKRDVHQNFFLTTASQLPQNNISNGSIRTYINTNINMNCNSNFPCRRQLTHRKRNWA